MYILFFDLFRWRALLKSINPCKLPYEIRVADIIALRSKAIVFGFKHRISEVFTSGDVSLHNILIFLSYEPFETCQILLWITKDDISFYSEISNVYM